MKNILLILISVFIGCSPQTEINTPIINSEPIPQVKNNSSQEIYQPTPDTSWQWQLSGALNQTYKVDLYDIDLEYTSSKEIEDLHAKGSKVICYFNGGAYEPYRQDSTQFTTEVLGKIMDGWEDEKWIDISNIKSLAPIMEARLDLAVTKNCNGVEPDNMDGYQNDSGFDLSYQDQITYNIWMADQAHQRGLSIALKNDLEQVADLVNYFDFAVNEECFQYKECDLLKPFITQNKAVLHTEYKLKLADFCPQAKTLKFSSLKLPRDLSGEREACGA